MKTKTKFSMDKYFFKTANERNEIFPKHYLLPLRFVNLIDNITADYHN